MEFALQNKHWYFF